MAYEPTTIEVMKGVNSGIYITVETSQRDLHMEDLNKIVRSISRNVKVDGRNPDVNTLVITTAVFTGLFAKSKARKAIKVLASAISGCNNIINGSLLA